MLKFLNKSSNNSRNRYHLLFISLLLVNYFFPLIIFGEITLFYNDKLDSELVYNQILGRIYRGDLSSIDISLAGEIKIEYLRRLFHPYSLLYGVFNHELAYWISDFLVKLTSYFSFFILAKKINKNIFLCSLTSCLFASINLPTLEGFGIAIFPYLVYLMLFKKKIKLKNYFLIIFFALNSDIVMTLLAVPIIPIILFAINKNILRNNLSNILKILFIFVFFLIVANSNLIFAQLYSEPFHREEFFREPISFLNNIGNLFLGLFQIPIELSWKLFYQLPFFIFLFPLIMLSFFSKDRSVYLLLGLSLLIHLFFFLLNTEVVINIRNNSIGLFKTLHIEYIKTIFPLLSVLLFLHITTKNISFLKYLVYPALLSILISQINSSIVPIGKKYFFKSEKDYQNIYTFRGYYSPAAYKEIKKIVKEERVLSIGLDPMVAVVNNIKTIDGYHSIYPLSYKAKFREIIKNEIENNEKFQKYYDYWGSRVYAFVSDPKNVRINYKAAKKIGANYIISKFNLESESLELKCLNCKNKLYLYKIL